MATPTKRVDGEEADAGNSQSSPPTPKSPLFSGAGLRRLGSKLSLASLSPKSCKARSPEKEVVTRLGCGHVTMSPLPLRIRRGSIRPLSIITTAFHPLDFDPVRTMEAVRGNIHPDTTPLQRKSQRMAEEKPRPRAIIDNMEMFGKQVDPFPPLPFVKKKDLDRDDDSEDTVRPADRSFSQVTLLDMSEQPASHRSSQRSTSFGIDRDDNNQRVITGNFASLLNLPPPDTSQHPAFQLDPTSSTSDAPLMVTTSTAEEIRDWAQQKRKFEAERGFRVRTHTNPPHIAGNAFAQAAAAASAVQIRPEAQTVKPHGFRAPQTSSPRTREKYSADVYATGIHSRKSSDNSGLSSKLSRLQIDRNNTETDIFSILAEGSPIPTRPIQPPKTPSTYSRATTPVSSEFDRKKNGLRKVSDIFKGRPSLDKTASDLSVAEPPDYEEFPFYRADLEYQLRRTLNAWNRDYNPGDDKPRHPNTSRHWNARNLKCTTCMEKCCPICKRTCCAYKAAVLALENHKDNPAGLRRARETILHITAVFPYGREAPTFLQCTRGDETGCGRMVCPDCCGQCPNDICRDIQCRKCKKNPWTDCMWHDEARNAQAL